MLTDLIYLKGKSGKRNVQISERRRTTEDPKPQRNS